MFNSVPVPEWVIMSAVRYALGRKSYIVSETIYMLTEVWASLSDQTKTMIVNEVSEYVQRQKNQDDYDTQDWKAFVMTANKYLKEQPMLVYS